MKLSKKIFEIWQDSESLTILQEGDANNRNLLEDDALLVDRIAANDGIQAKHLMTAKYYGPEEPITPNQAVELVDSLAKSNPSDQRIALDELGSFLLTCSVKQSRESGTLVVIAVAEAISKNHIAPAALGMAFYALGRGWQLAILDLFVDTFLSCWKIVQDVETAHYFLRALEDHIDAPENAEAVGRMKVCQGLREFFEIAPIVWQLDGHAFGRVSQKIFG